ncbi:probable G-protein coupled receptor 139 [Narcine bancroftii]|uniref:probable G-protein coupled receptor 139 n=1 Tax=Narcine bancroftii TaxID=1343680 RepID=UPI0038321051
MVAMALGDLMVVLTGVILNRVVGIYAPVSLLSYTPACRVQTVLVYISRDFSVWSTVAFTFDRLVAICCPKLRVSYCTERLATVIVCVVLGLSCLQYVPLYLALEPFYFANGIPMYCTTISNFYVDPEWIAYSWMNHIFTPCLALCLILLFNAVTVRHILISSRVRRALRGTDNNTDPELENRRKSVVLLFSISGSVVLLWATYTVHHLYYRITNTYVYSGGDDPIFILQEAGHMLLLLSCCSNTCIYVATQRKFREELKNGLKYPLTLVVATLK